MGEAVNLVAKGIAPKIIQPTEGATYDPLLNKKELQQLNTSKSGEQMHNFIRALDSTPGAWTILNGEEVRLFGSSLWKEKKPEGDIVEVDSLKGIIHEDGLLIEASDGTFLNIQRIKIGNRTIPASKYGKMDEGTTSIDFTEEESKAVETIRQIWQNILNVEVDNESDFFACGK